MLDGIYFHHSSDSAGGCSSRALLETKGTIIDEEINIRWDLSKGVPDKKAIEEKRTRLSKIDEVLSRIQIHLMDDIELDDCLRSRVPNPDDVQRLIKMVKRSDLYLPEECRGSHEVDPRSVESRCAYLGISPCLIEGE